MHLHLVFIGRALSDNKNLSPARRGLNSPAERDPATDAALLQAPPERLVVRKSGAQARVCCFRVRNQIKPPILAEQLADYLLEKNAYSINYICTADG